MATSVAAGAFARPAASVAQAARIMRSAAAGWLAVAFAGQGVFAAYITALYGRAAATGDWAAWNRVMPHGLIEGDGLGNAALVFHLLVAFAVTVGGPLQILPQLRRSFPRFHRWNGRLYLVTGLVAAVSGLVLVWSRAGLPGWSPLNSVAISANALAILVCGAMALRYALRRDIATHRRWALRLFMVMSGVWFLRLLVTLWAFAFGPTALGANLTGPAGIGLTFAQVLLPLVVLELYFWGERSASAGPRWLVATLLGALTGLMAMAIVFATLGMWLPHIL